MKRSSPSNPSSTFYWKDYENDEGLRVSSLAAQGLWMRLLCVAAKADPYGYVLINGCEIGVTGVARLGSVTETEAATLLDELERNGVFSRDRKGRIYSRRMVKESAVRKKAVENGKKGGNPALSASVGKQTEKDLSVNLQDNGGGSPLNPYPYPIEPNGSKDGGGDSVRERLLAAMGVGPDGVAGPSKFIGTQGDMAEAQRWLALPGITPDVACDEIRRIMAGKKDGPPSSFKYFTRAMQEISGKLSAPPLEPARGVAASERAPPGKLWNLDPSKFNDDGTFRQ